MSYFKFLQQNKRKRINSIKHEPPFYDPTVTKQVSVSNRREADNLIVKERFIARERANSEHQAERAIKLVVDTAKKIERTTGKLDAKGAFAKLRGTSWKSEQNREQNEDLSLPEIVVSSPRIERSRLTRERINSVGVNMNNVVRERSNSTETRKNGHVCENTGLPTIIRTPRVRTFTVGSLDAHPVTNELSHQEMKDRPRSESGTILAILARKQFASQKSTGRFEDCVSAITDDSRKFSSSRSRSNSTSSKDFAPRETQAFYRSKLLSEDSQPSSRSSSKLSLPESKFSSDSEDSWPHMDDTVFEDSK